MFGGLAGIVYSFLKVKVGQIDIEEMMIQKKVDANNKYVFIGWLVTMLIFGISCFGVLIDFFRILMAGEVLSSGALGITMGIFSVLFIIKLFSKVNPLEAMGREITTKDKIEVFLSCLLIMMSIAFN